MTPTRSAARTAGRTDGGGRRAIVTGAARGIGLGLATRLVEEGYDTTLVDVDRCVESAAAALDASFAVIDLTAADASTRLNALVDAEPCWLLVNNAGIFDKTPLLEIDLAEWDRVQAVNARSMVATMQAVVPSMVGAGGGRVVNMASMAAKVGTPGEAAYAASKAAVVALSRIAATEFGGHGITVNSVCPGYVLTDMGADTRDDEQVAGWVSMSPLGRLANADDIASLVIYLASDGASYITGQALNVTGGMCTN
ncbi:MAG: SDR family NAD(P)-dependent oxidoreductase [Ilumatobacter sp.]|uniref:SDR family NAD(P)-dependent oxidoreductase n=1 Tax=Ilumatobacter sp. TaxID=1967498 RepID=UPI003C7452A3